MLQSTSRQWIKTLQSLWGTNTANQALVELAALYPDGTICHRSLPSLFDDPEKCMSLIDFELDSLEGEVSSYDLVAVWLSSTSDTLMLTHWLSRWIAHTTGERGPLAVPNIACSIVTPLAPSTWLYFSSAHPSPALVKFFIQGIYHRAFASVSRVHQSSFAQPKETWIPPKIIH